MLRRRIAGRGQRSLPLTPQAQTLLEPVLAPLTAALGELPPIALGDVDGYYALDGPGIVLCTALAGPDVRHPHEPEGPLGLDRWRRAASCVLEGAHRQALALDLNQPVGDDWAWSGLAQWTAHLAAPQMGLAWADLATARQHAQLGVHPRQGVAACWAMHQMGIDVSARIRRHLSGDAIDEAEWLALGRLVLGPELAAELPVPVAAASAVDIPVDLGPWCWQPLAVPPHPRGGAIRIDGPAAVTQRYAVAGKPLTTLAAATGAARLVPETGGPLGEWTIMSAHAFGQIMGVHGVQFGFRGSGAIDVVLADAYAGPTAAVHDASAVGTSGVARGRWAVSGESTVRLQGLVPQGMTMHDNREASFVLPTAGMPDWLAAMQTDWRWEADGAQRLRMFGHMFGGKVEIRLQRAN